MATSLSDIPKAFLKGITHSRISLLGAMVVTISFPFLLGAALYDTLFHIANPYLSGFLYMILGPTFVGGLVLIFVGLFFAKGKATGLDDINTKVKTGSRANHRAHVMSNFRLV